MKATVVSFVCCVLGATCLLAAQQASAAEIEWKGYTWTVTSGGMAGVAEGRAANVSIDPQGYLHLQIRKNGDTWTAAEIFSTTRLGFGTYQWQIDGPIDTFDKNVVLGLFPYGPAAGIGDDGTNEIDIEYSRWGQQNGPNGDWTNYPASGATVGERSYTFSLSGGTLSTSRFIWTSTSIEDFLLAGLEPPASSKSLLETWKYSPPNPKTNIPQQPLPLGMNLWCYAVPSDGKNVEVIVRDFQFIPEGASGGAGSGGAGGVGGATAMAGTSAVGGATAAGGATTSGGGPSTNGGTAAMTGGASPANAGSAGMTVSAGGVAPATGGPNSSAGQTVGDAGHGAASNGESSGCSCRLGADSCPRPATEAVLGWFGLLVLRTARHARRSRPR